MTRRYRRDTGRTKRESEGGRSRRWPQQEGSKLRGAPVAVLIIWEKKEKRYVGESGGRVLRTREGDRTEERKRERDWTGRRGRRRAESPVKYETFY